MKRSRLLGGLLALCLSLSLLAPAAFAAPRVTGVWEGYYYANQGQTGLTLTLREDGTGIFEFYNMPGRSNAADGSYTVEYTVDGTELSLVGKDWIEQPSGYHFVGLVGTVSGDEYTGYVSDSNSSSVSHSFPFYLIQDTYAGADSLKLLRAVMERIRAGGYAVSNVDCTVLAQAPKLAPHILRMRENIAAAMGVSVDQVSVKATTEEGLGFTGAKEGIAAHAVALLERA